MPTPTNSNDYWAHLLEDYFSVTLVRSKSDRWFTELRGNVKGWEIGEDEKDDPVASERGREINLELCNTIRHIKGLDYLPLKQEKRDSKRSKPLLKDIELWVWLYRKDVAANQDPDFAGAHSELGYRRRLLGKMKEAWEDGDLITAMRIITHPEYVEGLEDTRGPSPADSAWLVSKAEEQFGYDREEAVRAWVTDRKDRGLSFCGSNLLQEMADNMKPETAEPQPPSHQYDEEEMFA